MADCVDKDGRPVLTDAEALELLLIEVQRRVKWALAPEAVGPMGDTPKQTADDIARSILSDRVYNVAVHRGIRQIGGFDELRDLVADEMAAASDPEADGPSAMVLMKSLNAGLGGEWFSCSEAGGALLKGAGRDDLRFQRITDGGRRAWVRRATTDDLHKSLTVTDGAAFDVSHDGRTMRLRVESVGEQHIAFKHESSGKTLRVVADEFCKVLAGECTGIVAKAVTD